MVWGHLFSCKFSHVVVMLIQYVHLQDKNLYQLSVMKDMVGVARKITITLEKGGFITRNLEKKFC